jgi:hypothetical protein
MYFYCSICEEEKERCGWNVDEEVWICPDCGHTVEQIDKY